MKLLVSNVRLLLRNLLKAVSFFSLMVFSSAVFSSIPNPPQLSMVLEDSLLTLSWSNEIGAQGYRLFYAPYPDATSVESIDMLTATEVSGMLPPGSSFYVAIASYNSEGESELSNIESFTIPLNEDDPSVLSCSVDNNDRLYAWPFSGANGDEWVVHNYVDQLPGLGTQDYTFGPTHLAKTYDGHNGTDINVANFRVMDSGVGIYAIAPGVVTRVVADEPDRETSCVEGRSWNVVEVRQDDGNYVYYGHMRTDSPTVEVANRVSKGDLLGLIGSSGCSTHPHLHIEIRRNSEVIDPFKDKLWCDAPLYSKELRVMTAALLEAPLNTYPEPFKDPPPDLMTVQSGVLIAPIAYVSNGLIGDVLSVDIVDASGEIYATRTKALDAEYRQSYWFWGILISGEPGKWKAVFSANEEVHYEIEFEVTL